MAEHPGPSPRITSPPAWHYGFQLTDYYPRPNLLGEKSHWPRLGPLSISDPISYNQEKKCQSVSIYKATKALPFGLVDSSQKGAEKKAGQTYQNILYYKIWLQFIMLILGSLLNTFTYDHFCDQAHKRYSYL